MTDSTLKPADLHALPDPADPRATASSPRRPSWQMSKQSRPTPIS